MSIQDIINALNNDAFKAADTIASHAMNIIMYYWAQSFLVVLPLVAIYLFLRKDKDVFAFVVAAVVMYLVADIIKMIVREPRPCELPSFSWINTYGCEGGFSFPSDHAATLTGLAFFVNKYKYVRIAYAAWLIGVLFGRVYLGAHFLTDVIAGIVLSVVLGWILYRYKEKINGFCLRIFIITLKPLAPKKWLS
ncbi:MAG: phosphatase PAP2 family protein [Candidatus Micrarchaeaceae archaeon]